MRSTLRRYLRECREHRGRLVAFIALALLQLLVAAPQPFVVREVFDTALSERREGLLVGLALLIFGLQLATRLFGFLAATVLFKVSAELVRSLRHQMFETLYAASIRFHESNSIGDLHDRVVHESARVDTMTADGLGRAVPAALFTGGIMVVLAALNWVLFLVTAAFVPVTYLVNRYSRAALQAAAHRFHASIEGLSVTTFGSLRTMRQTRIRATEEPVRRLEDDALAEAAAASFGMGIRGRTHADANQVVIALWAVVVLTLGGSAVIDDQLSLGELFSFYAGLALLREPLDRLASSVPAIVAGRVALERVYSLLDADDLRPYTGTRQATIDGHLVLRELTFGYETGRPVLSAASLEVRPGEVVALTGANGSGKSTIANLILGFYRPAEGSITIDGIDYDELSMPHLRRQFGVLSQDPIMLPGTVRDNIVAGRPGVLDAEIEDAIELSASSALVAELEHGLDTRAYENGPLLSGGQMQRVALARALLGRPRLLILDEPSNHLDTVGLAGLVASLRSIDNSPAMILITHETQVAAIADRRYRIEHGVLIDEAGAVEDDPQPIGRID